jgi:hypothetical protein
VFASSILMSDLADGGVDPTPIFYRPVDLVK